MVDQESLWRALASPHRRALLDHLRDGPKTTGQLGKSCPDLTRFAVMQHLNVLEQAQLIVVARDGRQRFNHLNAVPLTEVYERWVEPFSSAAAKTALRLKRYAESQSKEKAMTETPFRVAKIELEAQVCAPPAVVFDALTKNLNDWWPHRIHPDGVVTYESKPGGLIVETYPGGSAVYGTIIQLEPGKKHVLIAVGFLGSMTARNEETVTETADGTIYRKSLTLWGEVDENLVTMFQQGTAAIVNTALKQYCEEGKKYVAAN